VFVAASAASTNWLTALAAQKFMSERQAKSAGQNESRNNGIERDTKNANLRHNEILSLVKRKEQ
jgi:uncharacterized protein YfiM (DUF2279 family)